MDARTSAHPSRYAVTRGRQADGCEAAGAGGEGYRRRRLVGPEHGSVHLEVSESFLSAGGRIDGHRHPHEESFFVLRGSPLVRIGEADYHLRSGDFGIIPVAMPHAWANSGEEAAWLTVRSPQPRAIGHARSSYRVSGMHPPTRGRPVEGADPSARYVGHFDEGDLPAPGQLSIPGYHGPNLRNVSIRVMIDELLGAQHHTLFIVQLEAAPGADPSASPHYHPFEEMYYLLRGSAEAAFGDESQVLRAGDLAWTAVNASHCFVGHGEEPARWIEAQAPAPPRSNGFIFENDWRRLAEQDGVLLEDM